MNKYDICNMALSFLGNTKPLKSFADSTTESRLCDRYYDSARKSLLAEFPYSFAKKLNVKLTPIEMSAEDIDGFEYTNFYEYPPDALRVFTLRDGEIILNPEGLYDICFVKDVDGNWCYSLVCDIEDVRVDYIFNQEDVEVYSPKFSEALAWKIATMIAPGISKDAGMVKNAYQMQLVCTEDAKRMEALQQKKALKKENRYMTARR